MLNYGIIFFLYIYSVCLCYESGLSGLEYFFGWGRVNKKNKIN